jgi:hypothetical protein
MSGDSTYIASKQANEIQARTKQERKSKLEYTCMSDDSPYSKRASKRTKYERVQERKQVQYKKIQASTRTQASTIRENTSEYENASKYNTRKYKNEQTSERESASK